MQALVAAAAGLLAACLALCLALAAWAPVARADDSTGAVTQEQPADTTGGPTSSTPDMPPPSGVPADPGGGDPVTDPGPGTDQPPAGDPTGTDPGAPPDQGQEPAGNTGDTPPDSGGNGGSPAEDPGNSSGGTTGESAQKGSSTRADGDRSASDGGRGQGASSGTTAAGGGPGAMPGLQGPAGTPLAPAGAGAPLPLVPIGSNLMAFEVDPTAHSGGSATATVARARFGGLLMFAAGRPPRPPAVRDKPAPARPKFSPLPAGTGLDGLPGQDRNGLFNLMGGGSGGGASFLFFGLLGVLALTLLVAPDWSRPLVDFAEAFRPSAYIPPIESPG